MYGLMPISLRRSVAAAACLIFIFHVADNSLHYQLCLLHISNQRFPDFKVVKKYPQCNGSAVGGVFRLFSKPTMLQQR